MLQSFVCYMLFIYINSFLLLYSSVTLWNSMWMDPVASHPSFPPAAIASKAFPERSSVPEQHSGTISGSNDFYASKWCRTSLLHSFHTSNPTTLRYLASWILPRMTRMAPAGHCGSDSNCQRPSRPWSQRIWVLALVTSGSQGECLILKTIAYLLNFHAFLLSNQLVSGTRGQNTLTLAPFTQITRNILHKTVKSGGVAIYQGGYMFTHGHQASALQSPMVWLILKLPKLAAWPTTMNPKRPVQALARSGEKWEKQQRMGMDGSDR